jgi:hypothetical protein
MIKRVNFTGRRRVPRERIMIEVFDGDPRTFDAAIDLSDFDAPKDAQVVLEATCAGSNTIPRFEWGTVGTPKPSTNRQLVGLHGHNIFFSLKIIDRTEQVGRILGLAEVIRPIKGGEKTATGRRGILPVESADLGHEPWRLDFRSEDVYLMVNEKIPDLKDRVRFDPQVYSLIYPPVVRSILQRALQEPVEEDDSSDHWATLWRQFGQTLHAEKTKAPVEESEEEQEEWISEVVDSFCRDHSLVENFAKRAAEANWEDAV